MEVGHSRDVGVYSRLADGCPLPLPQLQFEWRAWPSLPRRRPSCPLSLQQRRRVARSCSSAASVLRPRWVGCTCELAQPCACHKSHSHLLIWRHRLPHTLFVWLTILSTRNLLLAAAGGARGCAQHCWARRGSGRGRAGGCRCGTSKHSRAAASGELAALLWIRRASPIPAHRPMAGCASANQCCRGSKAMLIHCCPSACRLPALSRAWRRLRPTRSSCASGAPSWRCG